MRPEAQMYQGSRGRNPGWRSSDPARSWGYLLLAVLLLATLALLAAGASRSPRAGARIEAPGPLSSQRASFPAARPGLPPQPSPEAGTAALA
jgi:hypothetical protein